jgi:hypothetical protein
MKKSWGVLADDEVLFSKIIAGGETWVYHWNPPTKWESTQGISTIKKGKNPEFIRKADGDGVLGYGRNLTDECMKKGSTITGQVYNNHKHTAKETHNSDKMIILLHDNCRVHKARQIREVIDKCDFVNGTSTLQSRFGCEWLLSLS